MINNSYYPLKKHKDQVLEELSSRIDIVVLVNKPLTSMGDYTPNYFNINERDCLEADLETKLQQLMWISMLQENNESPRPILTMLLVFIILDLRFLRTF